MKSPNIHGFCKHVNTKWRRICLGKTRWLTFKTVMLFWRSRRALILCKYISILYDYSEKVLVKIDIWKKETIEHVLSRNWPMAFVGRNIRIPLSWKNKQLIIISVYLLASNNLYMFNWNYILYLSYNNANAYCNGVFLHCKDIFSSFYYNTVKNCTSQL